MNEIRIKLTEKQSEFLAASYQWPVVFFGGARGGGKSFGLRAIALYRAMETPGLKVGLFRRTYPELRANHVRPLLTEHPWLDQYYSKSENIINLPNGSSIEFCYCEGEDDVLRYQGREFHLLLIDEAGQWEEGWFWTLRGSNRSAVSGIQATCLLTGNPGGIGHGWLKRLFVDRRYRDREIPSDFYFIASMVYDNPLILEHDPDYVHRLESEPNEVLRRAYLDGDWSVFAGQFFSEFSVSTHVLPLDWQPEKHWQAFWSHDPGHWHPAVWLLFVTDERGGVYVLRELVEREMYPEEQSKVIHSWPESIRIQHNTAIGGADCWARGRDGGPTLAEQFSLMDPENRRVYLVKANTDRVQGARQVRDYLRVTEKGPRLMIHPRCKQLIACLPRLVHDPHRPEDVLKVDSTDTDPYCGDDTYDCLRYFLMSRPIQSKQDPDAPFVPYTYDDRVRMYVKKRRERLAKQSRLMSKGVDSVLGKKW